VISSSQGLYLYTNTEKLPYTQTPKIHVLSGIRTDDPGFRASEDSARLRPLGYRDRWADVITQYESENVKTRDQLEDPDGRIIYEDGSTRCELDSSG
jgi:hypothetical protein